MLGYITTASKMCGPISTSFKGKTVRAAQEPVLTEYAQISKEIVDMNKDITLSAGEMFVDGLGCMLTASRTVKFTTTEYVPKRSG
jgi:hypothetical protein